jgi:PhzF family phenazine biosynthesis protein
MPKDALAEIAGQTREFPMRIPIYQVDAFANRVFAGNPAAVCPLEAWLPEETMQSIAAENNLAETAFYLARGEDFEIRWFTPEVEIDLAGHPTLATAHVLFTELAFEQSSLRFHTKLGDTLVVTKDDGWLSMDFPARPPKPAEGIDDVAAALGAEPVEFLADRDGFAVFENEAAVQALRPDMSKFSAFDYLGIIATAPGDEVDFVSRFFAPMAGVPEDPVTGSAHCELIPFWAERLGKKILFARQISGRGGEIHCEFLGDRVAIKGQAITFMRGEIEI